MKFRCQNLELTVGARLFEDAYAIAMLSVVNAHHRRAS
jgi:hypothetical protein